MKNILELLFDLPSYRSSPNTQDSPFVKATHMRNEKMELLEASMTPEQQELLNAYFDSDVEVEGMLQAKRFRYAFHLGAQLMAELMQGKEELLN